MNTIRTQQTYPAVQHFATFAEANGHAARLRRRLGASPVLRRSGQGFAVIRPGTDGRSPSSSEVERLLARVDEEQHRPDAAPWIPRRPPSGGSGTVARCHYPDAATRARRERLHWQEARRRADHLTALGRNLRRLTPGQLHRCREEARAWPEDERRTIQRVLREALSVVPIPALPSVCAACLHEAANCTCPAPRPAPVAAHAATMPAPEATRSPDTK